MNARELAEALAKVTEALASVTSFVGDVAPSEDHFVWDALDTLHEAARALRDAEALAGAAAVRVDNQHNDTCSHVLNATYDCDCGHDALTAALAAFRRGAGGER